MTIRIKNTESNQTHLNNINQFFEVDGKFLLLYPTPSQTAYINTGQLTKRGYKKSLGL